MENLTVIPVCEEETWDEIVKSFTEYDVYYLNGYVKAFYLIGDGIPYLFYFHKEGTRAIHIFLKRDIAQDSRFEGKIENDKYFDIVTPYGYGGFLIEGNDYEAVTTAFKKFCQRSHIVSEFVRFHPLLENWEKVQNFYNEQYCGNTICMDLETKETVWGNLTSKNRNMIRKAQKAGLKTYWGRDKEIIRPFIEIYNETMRKDNADNYYFFSEGFYESILNDLKYNSMWFYVKKEEEIVSIAIFLFGNDNMHYHLSASRKEYQHLAPTNLLLYEAAIWGSMNGYKKLHMGGGVGAREDSLYKFKKAFNRKEDKQFYIGRKIYNDEIYNKLVNIRRNISENSIREDYFPLYRS